MPYVKRDDHGKVVAVCAAEQDDAKDWLDDTHPEIVKFHHGHSPGAMKKEKPQTPAP